MNSKFSIPINSHLLKYPNVNTSASHHSELKKLSRLGKQSWIKLDSACLNTRYRLNVLELNFKSSEKAQSIQLYLRHLLYREDVEENSTSLYDFFLVAQPGSDSLYYNITEYIQNCIAGDIAVAERLIGRTILYIFQSDENGYDLLSDVGVEAFIKRYLVSYIENYGSHTIIGFAFEPPQFLSVFDSDATSVPWSSTLLEYIRDENFQDLEKTNPKTKASFLPFLFYEKYNSPVIRSVVWQELTSQFVRSFIVGLRKYCHEHHLRIAMTINESARSLQYELRTLLQQIDCPILVKSETDTSRQFVVAKSVCSHSNNVGIMHKENLSFTQFNNDIVHGFNAWVTYGNNIKDSDLISNQQLDILQNGFPQRQILMLSPTQSLWMKPEEKQWNSITKAWGWLCQIVWNMGYDFDIVSEVQLFDAQVDKKKGVFHLNGSDYHLVLLPSCLSLHQHTIQRLNSFTKSKGKLIINAPVPYLLNGKIGLEPYLLERLVYGRRTTILDGPNNERELELRKLLQKWITPAITVFHRDQNQRLETVKMSHRMTEDCQHFYLYNSANKNIETLVEIIGKAEKIKEIEFATGKVLPVDSWYANGNTYLNCTFTPYQSRLLLVN